jgi:hypothetical protein
VFANLFPQSFYIYPFHHHSLIMKYLLIIISLTVFIACETLTQQLPDGYILQYEQNFNDNKSLSDFRFSNPQTWSIIKNKENSFLQFFSDTLYVPSVPSPNTIGILNNHIFGDFILEADIMPIVNDSGQYEICFLLGIKDSLKYYYVQLAGDENVLKNGIYLVKNAAGKELVSKELSAISRKGDSWRKIRIERNIVKRTIRVFVDNMTNPEMEVKDYELVMGYIGFGSYNCSCRIDNIRIWSQTVIPDETLIFHGPITE